MNHLEKVVTDIVGPIYFGLTPDTLSRTINVTQFQMKNPELVDKLIATITSDTQITDNFTVYIGEVVQKNSKINKYINFTPTKQYILNLIQSLKTNPEFKFVSKVTRPTTIVLDFSSPNLAKNMHVGHLRSTFIGDCIGNLLEYYDYNLLRRNHIGDYGLPFGKILEYVIENNIEITEEISLQELYIKSNEAFKSSPEFNKKAYLRTQMLQNKSCSLTNLIWDKIYEKSLKSYQQIYDLLGTSKELKIQGEAFYHQYITHVKDILGDVVYVDEEGRTSVKVKDHNPMTYIKSDGFGNSYTYDTTDIAALWYRLNQEKADEVYYVVDTGQSDHFKGLIQLADDVGWTKDKKIEHINFGVINGSDNKRLKSRDGEAVPLQTVLDDAIEYVGKTVIQNKDMTKQKIIDIAIGSVKYFDLMHKRTSDYKYDFKLMFQLNGNSYLYLMYGYARCNQILAKLNAPAFSFASDYKAFDFNELEEKDMALIYKICCSEHVLNNTLNTKMPHHLCEYMGELTTFLNSWYESVRCINFNKDESIKSINNSRIIIVELLKYLYESMFKIIGLSVIDKI